MPGPTSQFTIAKPTAGVLPISAVNAVAAPLNGSSANIPTRNPPSKLKVVIRRLPPALTQTEFQSVLGEDWTQGNGKISWMLFKPGKVAKELAKPSRPTRVYIQVANQDCLSQLATIVREAVFHDAQNSYNDPILVGPPTLDFAPYGRVPLSKRRNDNRQGTIDQDPEFIAFLEELTTPVPKVGLSDGVETAVPKNEAITVTPLIQHLRDKKAAKEKNVATKGSKHLRQSSKGESNESKAESKSKAGPTKGTVQESASKKPSRPMKIEKAIKETVKTSKKETPVTVIKTKPAPDQKAEASKPPREASGRKGPSASSTSAAARIIQRDLGIVGGTGSGKGSSRRNQAQNNDTSQSVKSSNIDATTKAADETPANATSKSAPPNEAANAAHPPKGPSNPVPARKNENAKPQTQQNPQTKSIPKTTPKPSTPTVNPTATQAFLKHANPSQGITEELISESLSTYGTISKVEIDKRKGFAYVDFGEPEGLQKAIAASPIKIAQGQVMVLERKDRPPTRPVPNTRGGAASTTVGPGNASPAPSVRGTRGGGSTGSSLRGGRGARGRGGGGTVRGSSVSNASVNTSSTTATTTPESSSAGNNVKIT